MISVIICTYNGEKYIRKCLDSVVKQTIGIENLEVILADDASTDQTIEILKEYEQKYPENIYLVLQKENSRQTGLDNRNVGFSYASGDYILFLDQDDWYEIDAMDILNRKAVENPDIDYIEYRYDVVDESGNCVSDCHVEENDMAIYEIEDEVKRKRLAQEGVIPGATYVWNKLYRKKFLEDNYIYHNDGSTKTGFSDNFFSSLVALYAKKIGRMSRQFYYYRYYTGSWSHNTTNYDNVQSERLKVGVVLWDECVKRGLLEEKREMVEYVFARTFLLKTFWKFLLKTDKIPYDTLLFIRKEMLKKCPNYADNVIMQKRTEMQQVLILLSHEWDMEFLEILRDKMLRLSREKGVEGLYVS